ncbi:MULTISPECIES: 50S ribosomal protein L22 [unclassified Pseudactinotalea]|uniref:50S ribosomal protein L22 n=1 Tax=Micrococcales TaxID=85006 RepID=UPI003C7CB2BB
MEAKAQARYVRVTPQKARRVVDIIRGKQTDEALDVLRFAPQAVAQDVRKIVESAIANARVKADEQSVAFNAGDLVISQAYVDEGPTLKRFRPRAQGRANRILKRTSHITVIVADERQIKGGPR